MTETDTYVFGEEAYRTQVDVANAGNSNPSACGAASTLVAQANLLIALGDKSAITAFGTSLESNINNDKFGSLCGGSD